MENGSNYNCEAISVDGVHNWLTQGTRICGKWILLLDIRGNMAFQKSHIKFAVNLRLSTLLLRRIFRGTAAVENVCPDAVRHVLEYRKQLDCCVVLYGDCKDKDAAMYAKMLQPSTANKIRCLDGGFEEFHKRYNHLCEGASAVPVSLGVSVKKLSLHSPCKHDHDHMENHSDNLSRPPTQILPFLYIGSYQNAGDKVLLKKLGVTAILNVSNCCPPDNGGSFDYKQISVVDNHQTDLLAHLDSAIEFIDSVKNKDDSVLVHCMAGISRSATVCIAFLMKHMNWDLQKAFDFLKDKRPCVAPNLSFMGQLLAFQRQLYPKRESNNDDDIQTKKLKSLSPEHCVDERPPTVANDICCGSNNFSRKNGLKLLLHAL